MQATRRRPHQPGPLRREPRPPGRAPSPGTRCRRGGRRRRRHRHPTRRRRLGCRCSRPASAATNGSPAPGRSWRPGSRVWSAAASRAVRTGTPALRRLRTQQLRPPGGRRQPRHAPTQVTSAARFELSHPCPRPWVRVLPTPDSLAPRTTWSSLHSTPTLWGPTGTECGRDPCPGLLVANARQVPTPDPAGSSHSPLAVKRPSSRSRRCCSPRAGLAPQAASRSFGDREG